MEHRSDSQQMDYRNDPKLRCERCKGTGRKEYEITNHGEQNERVIDRCKYCGGTGRRSP